MGTIDSHETDEQHLYKHVIFQDYLSS